MNRPEPVVTKNSGASSEEMWKVVRRAADRTPEWVRDAVDKVSRESADTVARSQAASRDKK